ncbi:hypothetical protein [Streptomyces cellulosae]|uniref:hypothetical protein n=1 Tax=Streptomyces cellulosae TaxID=1968 RepID=UPI002257A9BC
MFQPIGDQEAQALTQSLRECAPMARQLAGDAGRLLADHVRMAAADEPVGGVLVEARGTAVSVSWQGSCRAARARPVRRSRASPAR